jgi:hypothetical protein
MDGVLSMVNEPDDGEIVEVATVGKEGMVGVPVRRKKAVRSRAANR